MKIAAGVFLLFLFLVFPVPFAGAAGPYVFTPPPVPGFLSDALRFEPSLLDPLAVKYEASRGPKASPEDFLFAYLPGTIFADLLSGSSTAFDLKTLNGFLFLSGYEGGRWLNRSLAGGEGEGEGIGGSGALRLLKYPLFFYLDHQCGRRYDLLQTGEVREKRKVLDRAFDSLLQSYGYNRGYLLTILQHPPAGADLPRDYITCGDLLDCRYPFSETQVLAPLLPVREKLRQPPDPNWRALQARIASGLPSAVRRGEGVWQGIMADRNFSPAAFSSLVDISAEFLMINEAILLESAEALAAGDEQALDRALRADLALRVWLEAYVIGLGAD